MAHPISGHLASSAFDWLTGLVLTHFAGGLVVVMRGRFDASERREREVRTTPYARPSARSPPAKPTFKGVSTWLAPTPSLAIGGDFRDVLDTASVREYFEKYGPVKTVRILDRRHFDKTDRLFVNFEHLESAVAFMGSIQHPTSSDRHGSFELKG